MNYCLCYISKKRKNLAQEDIDSIIEISKEKNAISGISGILIEYKNHFIQHIEGDAIQVYELFEKIKLDSRHENINLLQYSPMNKRMFDGWNMAHRNIDIMLKNDEKFLKCANSLDHVIKNRSFWKGIETIEILSNLIHN